MASAISGNSNSWTNKQRGLLINGIEKYGIGNYKMISDEFLPKWVGITQTDELHYYFIL